MPSLTTLFRAAVMIVVGAVVVKGWLLYGPTNEQVKSVAVQALEMAQSTLQRFQPPATEGKQASDPRGTAPAFGNANQTAAAPPVLSPAPASQALQPPALAAAPDKTSQPSANEGEKMPALMSRLEQLGAAEPKLSPWGNDGRLFRFCCRASLANSPLMSQHFEAVADQPQAAVEQVVAKVESWRLAERAPAGLAHAGEGRLNEQRY